LTLRRLLDIIGNNCRNKAKETAPAAVKVPDIAAAAGVTIATASRSMNARYGVNPRTRERVLAACFAFGIPAESLSAWLVTGRSQLVGLIVSAIRIRFFRK
jgi:LacI family transcriptional regulator